MSWFSRNVLVTFIDDATNEAFAESEMPPANLPDSFAEETTLHIGGDDWSVVQAEPISKKEFTKSRSLTLRLRKAELVAPQTLSFSQLDITDRFDDNSSLGAEEWISTTPLNTSVPNPEASGLPSLDANNDEVYLMASTLSELRESIPIPDDGVYCPVCHIANTDLGKLKSPCPKCARPLLKFGWT
ncbi:MAG: hypothetical protein NXI04_30120 [Planctomycetaceae bacterium]|nr:hypothetical protein [Planctomycetaceae bacterium]